MNERQSFIAVTPDPECQRWLTASLADAGEIIPVDTPSIERILQLSDAVGAAAVFMQLSAANYRQETLLIEGLIAAKPYLPVLVVADANVKTVFDTRAQ